MQSIPPMYCEKKTKDKGIIPTCYGESYGNYCYSRCKTSYFFSGTRCFQDKCPNGQKPNGIYCGLIQAPSYAPTKINGICPKNTYLEGSKCYQDCHVIGMERCGTNACSLDKFSCGKTIIDMIMNIINGVIDLVSFCLTLGASAGVKAAKTTLSKGLQKVGKKGIEAGFKAAKKMFESKFKEVIEEKAKELAERSIDYYLKSVVREGCELVYKTMENEIGSKSYAPSDSDLLESLDVFEIGPMVKSCTSKDKYECVRNSLNFAKQFDPTGLLTIAATFVQPKCEVIPKLMALSGSENDDTVEDHCIQFFSEENYGGEMKEICTNRDMTSIAFDILSLKTNDLINYAVFTKENFQGRYIWLGKSMRISSMNEIFGEKTEEDENDRTIKSLVHLNDNCLQLFYTQGDELKRKEYCNNEISIDIDWDSMTSFVFQTVSSNLEVSLYSDKNFNGKEIILDSTISENDLKDLGVDTVRSIKIGFKHNPFGFLCQHEAGTKEIIRAVDNEIECLSFDGEHCLIKPMNLNACSHYLLANWKHVKPLRCGLSYKALHDITGYTTSGHWCQKGMKYFNISPEFIE